MLVRLWNYFSVGWLNNTIRTGFKRPLFAEDLLALPKGVQAQTLASTFDSAWAEFRVLHAAQPSTPLPEPGTPRNAPPPPGSRPHFILLIDPAEASDDQDELSGPTLVVHSLLGVAFILFSLQIIAAVASCTASQHICILEQNLTSTVVNAVYEKSMRLSQTAQKRFSQGRIVNLVDVDASHISSFIVDLFPIIITPIQFIVSIYLLYRLIGIAVFAGAGFLVFLLAAQWVLSLLYVKKEDKLLDFSDERLRVTREVLNGIKIVKFRALEDFFNKIIGKSRTEQVRYLGVVSTIVVMLFALHTLAPTFAPILSFAVYAIRGGHIRAAIIFPALTLFKEMIDPFLELSETLPTLGQAFVSWRRINSFLNADELESSSLFTTPDSKARIAVEIKNASFVWLPSFDNGDDSDDDSDDDDVKPVKESKLIDTKSNNMPHIVQVNTTGAHQNITGTAATQETFGIYNLSLIIPRGRLVAVVGPVGSGKSSLLAALTGEMMYQSGQGRVELSTYISYMRAMGGSGYTIFALVVFILAIAASTSTEMWLAFWTSEHFDLSDKTYLSAYTGLGAGWAFFGILLNVVVIFGGFNAAKHYHDGALKGIFNAPMSFFDTQPLGRIMNRMSTDIDILDTEINHTIFTFLSGMVEFITEIAIVIYASPIMIALLAATLVLYFIIFIYFQRTNRELRRLISIEKSPLVAHISETMAGISTIRVCSAEKRFVDRQRLLLDNSNRPAYMHYMLEVWLHIRMELLAANIVLALCILAKYNFVSAATIGLALTYSTHIAKSIDYVLAGAGHLEAE
eukprot:jgi/Hompol1/6209/HPOL_004851-RA